MVLASLAIINAINSDRSGGPPEAGLLADGGGLNPSKTSFGIECPKQTIMAKHVCQFSFLI